MKSLNEIIANIIAIKSLNEIIAKKSLQSLQLNQLIKSSSDLILIPLSVFKAWFASLIETKIKEQQEIKR
jgi:hypothetical protein